MPIFKESDFADSPKQIFSEDDFADAPSSGTIAEQQPSMGERSFLAESVGPLIGGTIGGTLGLAAPFPGSQAIGTAAGTVAGRVAQTGYENIGSALGLTDLPIKPFGETLEGARREGAIAGATSILLPPVVKGAMGLGKMAVKRATGVLGNVAGESFERMAARPREVLNQMKEVIDNPNRVKELGNEFKEAIENNFTQAQQAYQDIVKNELLQNPKYADKTFNLFRGVGEDIANIQKKYGFGLPGRIGAGEREGRIFRDINNSIQSGKKLSAEEAYQLQADINRIIREPNLEGTPLKASLVDVDKALQKYFKNAIPEIRKANEIYAEAAELNTFSKTQLERMEDLPGKISSAYKRNTAFKDKIELVADKLPAARRAIEGLRDAQAGTSFAPGLAEFARTGLTAGIGFGAVKMGLNPLLAAIAAPFLSPRLTGYGISAAVRGSQALAPYLQTVPGRIGTRTFPGVGLAEFYNRNQ